MRPSIAPLAVALLALGGLGCGGARHDAGSTSPRPGAAVAPAARAGGAPAAVAHGRASSARPARLQANYDTDDETLLGMGQAPSPADARAIDTLVERYYAAGARGDGAAACALTAPAFARTVPEDYGQELGSAIPPGAEAYLRGARSCAAVLSLLFEHLHTQLAAPVEVVEVRLHGDYGDAFVGSTTLPASLIEVAREHGVWRVGGLLGRPLP